MAAKLARLVAFVALALSCHHAMAQEPDIVTHPGITYASPAGKPLLGDFYGPKSDHAPIIVAVHGGGWQGGNRSFYQNWGPYLAKRGYALFAIDYRLSKPAKAYPEAVSDVRAAIRFIKHQADTYHLDASRLALMGDSAGSHLAALVALTDRLPGETAEDAPDADRGGIKAVVLFYGVYDMAAQWHHDQLARPLDQITQTFLGATPMQNRQLFFESSPISHVEQDQRNISFLLTYGTADAVADPHTQSDAFFDALSESGKYVRKFVVPFAPHFWSIDPIEEPGSYSGMFAPRMLRFLQERL